MVIQMKKNYVLKHGMSYSKIYSTWQRIKNRCYRENFPHYKSYGGRGIKVCDEWLDKENGFINFKNWAFNNGYKDGLSIDRINVNGNYEPSNCRWITMKEQASNKRTNIFYTINGKTMTQTQWCEYYNIPRTNIRRRISSGWSVLDAYTKPIRKKGD